MDKKQIAKMAKCELSRRSFWDFNQILYPKFYKGNRHHLKKISDTLQALYEGRIIKIPPETEWRIVDSLEGITGQITCKKLMLNMPPRHGKSFTATNFAKWVLGKDNENRLITVSYNEKLSGRFAKSVRDGIDEIRIEDGKHDKIIFSDIFPTTKIKQGDGSYQMWSLEGQYFNYLATSPTATLTGVGCNIGIIDDIIKDKYEAYNDNILENHWDWYINTYLSRLEEGAMQIVIMTRWSTKDLCGKLLEKEPGEWYELKMKAYDKVKDEMLCPELLSKKSYEDKKSKTSTEIIEANYQQEPVDIGGKLYKDFKTYKKLPEKFERVISYTDTADTGEDSLVSVVGGVYKGEIWLLDVYMSNKGMEVTEPGAAKFFYENYLNHGLTKAKIESNNGGRGFARNVERELWETFKTRKVSIEWFHQSNNKKSRILSNSNFVMEHVYFPWNWMDKWPEYYKAMSTYQREGKNEHDDAPDATTGIVEMVDKPKIKLGFA
ncbi:phage terminase large subunit [Clostridium sp. JN-9]|uniref:phage terminase large subunit n=1 Tax=Clostridium sp. JN-9 TaxID=2507159 RepID=UPI000FFE222E|nr:phage terminase large subunit [Clostridium sp. JN-9]QAT40846.1 terminase [Clostridium sp. JN-9]